MKQFTLDLDKYQKRPVVILNNGLSALLDTGADIPVWVDSTDILIKHLNAKSLQIKAPLSGYGGTTYGEVFRLTLSIGELIFPNMLIIANDEIRSPYNMILSSTMFSNLIYEIDDKNHKLNVSIPNDESNIRNIVLTDTKGSKLVLSQN
jgi:hypothetical protein